MWWNLYENELQIRRRRRVGPTATSAAARQRKCPGVPADDGEDDSDDEDGDGGDDYEDDDDDDEQRPVAQVRLAAGPAGLLELPDF